MISLPPPPIDDAPRPAIGVGAIAIWLPRYRVPLDTWCAWTGNDSAKVRSNIGHSFRVLGPDESVYTMAANAALRLILDNDVDPRAVGFLALGTESGSDNSAGAVLVRGMLDQALETLGRPRLSRSCEVPEFKHACLGGVYAQKAALRYLASDGRGRKAIVVAADVAEYARGSSGEQTQGAGAVALLIEESPALYEVDFWHAGSSSAYRGVDFRKPHHRHLTAPLPAGAIRRPDYPVFNGFFSTVCYTDAALHATARMLHRLGRDARELYNELDGAFFHRPYHRLPVNVMAALYVWGLTRNPAHHAELEALCREAGSDFAKMMEEASSNPDLFDFAMGGHINKEVYPESMRTVKHFRGTAKFKEVQRRKIRLGAERMMELGNLYTGSLFAWIAAGLEEALATGHDISGHTFFTLGYGSGDAAEATMIRVVPSWREAAARIGFAEALAGAIDLARDEYEALHDGFAAPLPRREYHREFIVDRIGKSVVDDFEDLGIEYYRFIP